MSRNDPIFDSQETVFDDHTDHQLQSQDLFGTDPPVQMVQVPEKILKDILQELKDLRKSVNDLKENSTSTCSNSFRVEDQTFHKSYFQFLKGIFCECPWLDVESEDFKREVRQHIGDSAYKFKIMCSFSYQKFTQMRNQLRRMIFHSTMDIQGLSLDGLCNYLYKPFTPPGESPVERKRKRNTVAMRAFLSSRKFQECEKFWVEFKEFYDTILVDSRTNIWDLLKEKEEKRIKRYREEQDQQREQ